MKKTKKTLSVVLTSAMLLSAFPNVLIQANASDESYECYDFESETLNGSVLNAGESFESGFTYYDTGSSATSLEENNDRYIQYKSTGTNPMGLKKTFANSYGQDEDVLVKFKYRTLDQKAKSIYLAGGFSYTLYYREGKTGFYGVGTGVTQYGINSVNVFDNEWHEFAFEFPKNEEYFKMYIDGVLSEKLNNDSPNIFKRIGTDITEFRFGIGYNGETLATSQLNDFQIGSTLSNMPGTASVKVNGSEMNITASENETILYGIGLTAAEARAALAASPVTYTEPVELTQKVYVAVKCRNNESLWEGATKVYSVLPIIYEKDDLEDFTGEIGSLLSDSNPFPSGWSKDGNYTEIARIRNDVNDGNVIMLKTTGNADSGLKKTFVNTYTEDAQISFKYKFEKASDSAQYTWFRIGDASSKEILQLRMYPRGETGGTTIFNRTSNYYGDNSVNLFDGEWHTIKFNFTAGSNTFTMSIDDIQSVKRSDSHSGVFSSEYTSSEGIKSIALKPGDSTSGTIFYIDDVIAATAPESIPHDVSLSTHINKVSLVSADGETIKYATGSDALAAYNNLNSNPIEYSDEITVNFRTYLAAASYIDGNQGAVKVYLVEPIRYENYDFQDETLNHTWSADKPLNSGFGLANTGTVLTVNAENSDQYLRFRSRGNSNYGPRIIKDFGTDNEFVGNVGLRFRFRSSDEMESGLCKIINIIGRNAYEPDKTRNVNFSLHSDRIAVSGDGHSYTSVSSPQLYDDKWHDVFIKLNMNTGLANLYIDNTEIGFTVNDASTFDVPVPQIKSVRTMGWCFYDQNNSAYMHQILIDDVQVSNVVSDMPGIVNVTESNDVITLESAQSSMIKYALAKTPNGAAAKLAAQPITYTEPFEVPGVNKYIAAQAYGHNGDFEGSYKVYGPYSNSNAVDLNKFYHLSPWTVLAAGGVSKTDTLQLGNKSGQIRISASDNVSNPEYIADSRSADNAGNVLSLTADSDIYIDFKDSYKGSKRIDDIKLVFRTVKNLAAYDFDLFYKTAEGEYVFFYGDALDDATVYSNDRYQYMYPTVVLSGFDDKLPADIAGLKISFNANDNGNATDVCEIDMNLKDDRLDVQREDAGIELSFAKIYSDNMVIQRDKPIKLWGYGGYEDMDITVEVKNSKGASVRTATVSTDAEQKWYAELPAIEGGVEKYTIEISETDDELGLEPCVITNVVFGDVYIGSGQSNMELSLNNTVTPLKTSANGTVEAERIENELKTNDYSNVRFFRYPKYLTSLETLDDAYTGQWVTAEKFENIAGVSAVSYFFAKDLYNQLDGEIPVAVLTASAGGSSINAWIPNDGSLTPEQISNNTASAINSGFYNAMIYPFTKVNIKGVIWYQGEADANQYEPYKNKYNTLKSEWRGHWGTDLDFTAVQLTSYGAGNNWALMRQGQMQSWLKDENSGLVNTIDVGSETTIHPLYKAPVGNRLALNVAARLYNKDIEYQGPLFESLTKSGDALVISFTHADGLKAQSRTNPYTENFEEDNAITGFEVSADGNNWVSANAVINGNTVTVTGINNPKYVRYAWANAPVCNLYNSSDLPAVPFKANINDVESAPTITVAGNTATISGNAVDGQKLKNDFVVAVAKFKNNILQSVELKEFNTILNENTSFEFTTEDSENDIEVMIFDSMENLTPLTYKAVK